MTRYQITFINKDGLRQLFGAAQGWRMRRTREEAEAELRDLIAQDGNKGIYVD